MKFDPSKAHYVVLIYGSCNTQFPIMSSVVTQCTFFKDVSTKGATLTKLSHLCHRRSCIWLMNEFYWWEIVGVSWMCWLVNYVHAACLLSKPAVKERNIHDLCLYTQMCVCVCRGAENIWWISLIHACVSVEYRGQCYPLISFVPWVEATPGHWWSLTLNLHKPWMSS